VDVGGDHSHGPPWNTGNRFRPQLGRQILDEVHRHTVVRSPSGDYRTTRVEISLHIHSFRLDSLTLNSFGSSRNLGAGGCIAS
jgi:hypothetical protein